MTSISSQVISLGSLLGNGDIYVVPPYQRNYAWEEDQYSAFWSDISKTFAADSGLREYFMGSLVINNSLAPQLRVIDGQQRLITTAVLIAALRGHLLAADETEAAMSIATPRLVLNKTDKAFYDEYVLSTRFISEIAGEADNDERPHSNRLIAECFCFMHGRIDDLCAEGQPVAQLADAIMKSLNERVLVIRIDVKDDYNAFLLFETLNDRGLELSEADLLKNHLFAVSEECLTEMQGSWDMMEQNLGTERLIKFVRHHWLSTRGPFSERGLYSDIKGSISTVDTAVAYIDDLCDASEDYAALMSSRHCLWNEFPVEEQTQIRELIDTIELLRPEQLFIVLLAALSVDRGGFLALMRMLVNFTFRYSTICSLTPSGILQPFVNMAREIRDTQKVETRALFQKHLSALYPDDSQFHSAFSRKIVRGNAQARYILKKINELLAPSPAPRAEGDPFDLEHILPKRYGTVWEGLRREFPGGIDKYVYRLGNMTLISARLNRNVGNAEFATKKKAYAADCMTITRKVLDAEKWTAEEIKNRQNWLAALACKIWRYPAH
jgi:hypothetical protein